MGQLRRLPKRARVVECETRRVIAGPRNGETWTLTRYRVPDHYADGGVEFVTVEGPSESRCFRYSGRNVADAAGQLRRFREDERTE